MTPTSSDTFVDISVVICAYTEARWDDLVAAVESVRRQSAPPKEIIVAVDHNLRLLARVREHIPGVVAVENREPRGLSGTRNSGIDAAHGAVIAFLDEDALAAPDWLERLNAEYQDPTVAGVGGAIEPLWLNGRPAWFPEEFAWVVGCTYRGMPQAKAPIRNLIGCNMSFRREVFEASGRFRSGIGRIGTRPVGCEETEFCIRATRRSTQGVLLYEPQARVRHRVPASRATWRYFTSRCYAEGLSKALVAHFVGAGDGLDAERRYTLRTLPQGIFRGIADALFRRDPMGLARAGAIIAGLAITTIGYGVGTIHQWLAETRQPTMDEVTNAT
jgi:glycosyltransferase involved in cell wall biosynthesis